MKNLQSHIQKSQSITESLSGMEQEILTESLVSGAQDFKNGTIKIDQITPLFQMSKILKVIEKVSANYAENEEDSELAEPLIHIELMEFTNKVAMKKFGFVTQVMLEYFAANYMSI